MVQEKPVLITSMASRAQIRVCSEKGQALAGFVTNEFLNLTVLSATSWSCWPFWSRLSTFSPSRRQRCRIAPSVPRPAGGKGGVRGKQVSD